MAAPPHSDDLFRPAQYNLMKHFGAFFRVIERNLPWEGRKYPSEELTSEGKLSSWLSKHILLLSAQNSYPLLQVKGRRDCGKSHVRPPEAEDGHDAGWRRKSRGQRRNGLREAGQVSQRTSVMSAFDLWKSLVLLTDDRRPPATDTFVPARRFVHGPEGGRPSPWKEAVVREP